MCLAATRHFRVPLAPRRHDQEHQRNRGRCLDERPEREDGGGRQLPLRRGEVGRGGDRQHHESVDVTAAQGVEQHDRVQTDERDGVRGLGGLTPCRAWPRTRRSRASLRSRARGTRRSSCERVEHRCDRRRHPDEHRAVHRRRRSPARPYVLRQVVRRVVRRRVRVGVAAVPGHDAAVVGVAEDVPGEQERQHEDRDRVADVRITAVLGEIMPSSHARRISRKPRRPTPSRPARRDQHPAR